MNNTVNRSCIQNAQHVITPSSLKSRNLRLYFKSQVEPSRSTEEERAEAAAEINDQQQQYPCLVTKYDEKHKTPSRYNAGDYVVKKQ